MKLSDRKDRRRCWLGYKSELTGNPTLVIVLNHKKPTICPLKHIYYPFCSTWDHNLENQDPTWEVLHIHFTGDAFITVLLQQCLFSFLSSSNCCLLNLTCWWCERCCCDKWHKQWSHSHLQCSVCHSVSGDSQMTVDYISPLSERKSLRVRGLTEVEASHCVQVILRICYNGFLYLYMNREYQSIPCSSDIKVI